MSTIGVKLELSSAEFREGMKEATSQVKLFDAQLKGLSKGLSGTKSAFEQHTAKTEALKGKLSALKDEQALLTAKLEEAKSKYGENSTQANGYATKLEYLNQSIEATQQELDKQGGTLGAVGAQFEAVGSKLQDVGAKITQVGTQLTTKITVPLMAIGGASIAAFNEVDDALDTVRQKTGATGEDFEEMKGIVENIATSIPTSFDKVGEAVGEVSTRFGVTGDELEALSAQFVKFAEINNTDVTTSIDSVQKALSAYGEDVSKAPDVLDRMNKVAQETGVSVDKLSSGIVSNGTAFQEMGLSMDEAITFMGQLEKSGANSETVLNGMRKALKSAAAEGKPLDEALAELQNTIENGTDGMDGLTAAYDMFGKSGDQIYGAVKNGTINFKELVSAMTDAGGSVSDTFESTVDPIDQLQMHMNELKLLGTDIANAMMPMITTAMETLGNVIKNLADAWNGLDEGQQQMIIKIGLVAAAVGPVLVAIGSLVGAIGTIISTIGTVTSVIGIASGALAGLSIPILPIIAAIAGVVAVGVLLYKNWDTITEKASELASTVKEKVGTLVEGVKGKWEELKSKTSETWENIKEKTSTVADGIKTVVKERLTEMKTAYDEHGGGLKGTVAAMWTGIMANYKSSFQLMNTLTKGKLGEIVSAFTNKFTSLKNSALTWGRDMIQNFINGINQKIEAVKASATKIAETVKKILGFSEPEEGPLSNFHTFAPDMMKLYAKGMEDYAYLVKNAATDVSADVASGLSGGDTHNYGGISIVVNGTDGQTARELADIIEDRLQAKMASQKAVWA